MSINARLIFQAFGCQFINTYGMSELVTAASECEYGRLHIWPEAGVAEILSDTEDIQLPMGETGRIICTGLLNTDMPLIRYEVGDRGTLDTGACNCKRNMQAFLKIEGRIDDVLITPDGRSVGRLDPVFKTDLDIREAQIVQESFDIVRLRFVPGPHFNNYDELVQRLQQRLGSMHVILEPVDKIPRGANGKFKAVISKVSANEAFQ